MKKIIALLIVLMLLVGCTPTPAPVSSNNQDLSSADDTASVSSVESVADVSSETPTTSTVPTSSKTPTTTSKPTSSKPKVDNEPAYAKAGGVIPTGATYTVKATGKVLKAGEKMPSKPADGDIFSDSDYNYTYHEKTTVDYVSTEYWAVGVIDRTKTSYGKIIGKINGKPLKSAAYCFHRCGNLLVSPEIPDSVECLTSTWHGCNGLKKAPSKLPKNAKDMEYAFCSCISIESAPAIPSGVTNLFGAFSGCAKLKKAPAIPSKVLNMACLFYDCATLSGAIEINANPIHYAECFYLVPNEITVTGTTTIKDKLLATQTFR